MNEFILRIFFSGLIALIPNADGTELTVVLVNTPHEYTLASGEELPPHLPMLLGRAAKCEETCVTADHRAIAQFMFRNKTATQAETALNHALLSGGAWKLSGSDLTIGGTTSGPLELFTGTRKRNDDGTLTRVPSTAAERADFSWVADLTDLAPQTKGFKSSLIANEPPPGCLIAARLKLTSGKFSTYSLVKIDAKARPVHFRKATGQSGEAPYAQALANWVVADIRMQGNMVEITDQSFNDSTRRRVMRLYPQDKLVEIALVNFPPVEMPAPDAPPPSPTPGYHFEVFYDLVRVPPAHAQRLVPFQAESPSASDPQADWDPLHPRDALWSNLLEALGMSPRGKGPYDLSLCPMMKD